MGLKKIYVTRSNFVYMPIYGSWDYIFLNKKMFVYSSVLEKFYKMIHYVIFSKMY